MPLVQPGNATWFDDESQLAWRRPDSAAPTTYDKALALCAALNADPTDAPWRLPRLAELRNLRLHPEAAGRLDPVAPSAFASLFWTTDRYLSYTALNWSADLRRGIDRPARRAGANPDKCAILLVKGHGGLYPPSITSGMNGRWTRSRAVLGVPVREGGVRITFRALHPVITPAYPVQVSLASADGLTSRTVRFVQPGSATLELPVTAPVPGLIPITIETCPAWFEGGEERGVFVEESNWSRDEIPPNKK